MSRSKMQDTPHTPTPEELDPEFKRASLEGPPANANLRRSQIAMVIAIFASLFVIVGLLIVLFIDQLAGGIIIGLGLASFLLNPQLWAAIFRAGERR